MKKLKNLLIVTLFVSSAGSYAVEITPLYGYRGGGEFIDNDTQQKHTVQSSEMYGFIIGFPYERGKDWEIYYSHQSSDIRSVNLTQPATTSTADIPLTIDYLHIGGTAPISEENKLKTFVSGGVGFTYLSPDFSGFQSDLRASLSIGIGLKYFLSENIAVRLEARGLGTLFNSNAALFCNGGCSLSVNGSLFTQIEAFAGLAFRF
ncbi:MAG: porin family protein [Gammaproteobacteria bacterium]|nr:porin family protein [Gammaproteobacteria bacterium]